MTDNTKQYAERDIMELDELGGFYALHVHAMTAEGLHSKSDIAAELAHRDAEISRLKALLGDTANVGLSLVTEYGVSLDNLVEDWEESEMADAREYRDSCEKEFLAAIEETTK